MHQYRRHTLLTISQRGRRAIYDKAIAAGMDSGMLGQMLLTGMPRSDVSQLPGNAGLPLPGIVRRDCASTTASQIPVGFTSWVSGAMGRLRLPAFVDAIEVQQADDPFAVLSRAVETGAVEERTPALRALRDMVSAPGASVFPDAALGIWGSVGMELATGYYYSHAQSDLDIILRPYGAITSGLVAHWMTLVTETEGRYNTRVDADIRLPGGYDVSLKECASGSRRVLAKSASDVILMPLTSVLGQPDATA